MKTQHIGQFSVQRITESEGPFAPVGFILPDVDMAQVDAQAPWVRPGFVDAQDRLVMSFHSYVLKTARYNILIDSCVGNHKERPLRANWHRQESAYLAAMAAAGVAPHEIDFVCCTHLHADHVGWNTSLRDGAWVPTFPKARYVFSRTEYAFWEGEHRHALASGAAAPNHGSFGDSVLPVVDAGQAVMVDDGFEFDHGVHLHAAAGHTPGNCVLHARSQGAQAVFSGDIFHSPVQLVNPDWSSRFCHDPAQAAAVRHGLAQELADTPSLLLAGHFPSPVAGRVVSRSQGFGWETEAP